MTVRKSIGSPAVAIALVGALGFAPMAPAEAQQGWGHPMMMGPGMMGPGMMGPGMMGPGMMGPAMMGCPLCGPMMGGYGPGMMGWGYGAPQGNLNLSPADVKGSLDRYIVMMGNPRLKAGPVAEKDANTITAEIVTSDKDVVIQRFNVDRQTGFWQPAQ